MVWRIVKDELQTILAQSADPVAKEMLHALTTQNLALIGEHYGYSISDIGIIRVLKNRVHSAKRAKLDVVGLEKVIAKLEELSPETKINFMHFSNRDQTFSAYLTTDDNNLLGCIRLNHKEKAGLEADWIRKSI